nr:hypothetical protein CFP56_37121 [Quercus suber]
MYEMAVLQRLHEVYSPEKKKSGTVGTVPLGADLLRARGGKAGYKGNKACYGCPAIPQMCGGAQDLRVVIGRSRATLQ